MRKLITAASILLIFISLYGLLKIVFGSQQVQSRPATAVATTPTPSPELLLASTTPPPVSSPESTSTSTPALTTGLDPLKIRVIKHRPEQFQTGAISNDELSAINKAISAIPWSRNSNPQAAAHEDYAAIVKESAKSDVPELLTDLVTEAVSNDYQPNNQAANGAYSAELNSNFENGDQSDKANGKNIGETVAGQGTSADSESTPAISPPSSPATVVLASPAEQSASPKVIRPRTGRVAHRPIVQHRVVDAKTRLLALWHQSLAATEKSPIWTPCPEQRKPETKN